MTFATEFTQFVTVRLSILERILAKNFEVTFMVGSELVKIGVLREARDFGAFRIVFVIYVVCLDVQLVETLLD